MTDEIFKNWVKEPDGTVRLWPSTGGQAAIVGKQIIAVRIDYEGPDTPPGQTDKFQFHITPEHARHLGRWLLEAAQAVLQPPAGNPMKN